MDLEHRLIVAHRWDGVLLPDEKAVQFDFGVVSDELVLNTPEGARLVERKLFRYALVTPNASCSARTATMSRSSWGLPGTSWYWP